MHQIWSYKSVHAHVLYIETYTAGKVHLIGYVNVQRLGLYQLLLHVNMSIPDDYT